MHEYADFHEWLRDQDKFRDWKSQNYGSDTSTSKFLESLSDEEVEELREEYDKEMKDSHAFSKRSKKEDY